jgi:hypothetical protein
MQMLKKSTVLTAIATLGVVLTSCSVSKVEQCNKMIAVVNEASAFGQEFGKNPGIEKGGKAFTEASDKLDAITAKLEAIELQDEKLKGLQTSFVTMYKGISTSLRSGAEALDKKDAEALKGLGESIQKNAEQEATLVNEANTYCSGK